MEKFTIKNCMDEIEIEVEFDYDPAEPEVGIMTDNASIYEVRRTDNDTELCLLQKIQKELEEELCERAYEYRQERIAY
jgi:hypothetical protein